MVRRVMAGDQSPQHPGRPDEPPSGAGQGWSAIAYLLGGMAIWGFIGWLVDRWLDTGGIATGIGAVVGAAGGVYLVVRRLGAY
jgi:F0F1-type ATP synthase assembly protein I